MLNRGLFCAQVTETIKKNNLNLTCLMMARNPAVALGHNLKRSQFEKVTFDHFLKALIEKSHKNLISHFLGKIGLARISNPGTLSG